MSNTKFLYKVAFRPQESAAEDAIMYKFYKTQEEAFQFAKRLGERVVETTQQEVPDGYPDSDLDFS
jgi:hypothetical protein